MSNFKPEDQQLIQLVAKHAKIGGSNYDEMATVMGVTKNAVSCRWNRLQKKIAAPKPSFNDADNELLRLVCKTVNITASHYQDIAAEMGVTKNAVSCRWNRLQKKLGVGRTRPVGKAAGKGKRVQRAVKKEDDADADDRDDESGRDEMAQDANVNGEDDEMEGEGCEGDAYEGGAYEGGTYEGDAYEGGTYGRGAYEGGTYEGDAHEGSAYENGVYEGGAVQGVGEEGVMDSVEQEQGETYFDAEDNIATEEEAGGMDGPSFMEREDSYYDHASDF